MVRDLPFSKCVVGLRVFGARNERSRRFFITVDTTVPIANREVSHLALVYSSSIGWNVGGCALKLDRGDHWVIVDGVHAFMDVEDDTAGENGVQHTGQSATV